MTSDIPWTSYRNQQQRLIEFEGGGSISIKSADKPDNLRGSGLNYVVVDEAAFIDSEVIWAVIMPSLQDRKGDALFISTPNGRNHFHSIYQMGRGDDPEWMSWQYPSWINPIIDRKEIEKLRLTTADHIWRTEFLAEFTGTGGGVFPGFEDLCELEPYATPGEYERANHYPEGSRRYTAGIDWGRKNDFTVFTIFDRDSGDQVWIYRFTDIGYTIQAEKIIRQLHVWKPEKCYVETNSMGDVMYERLREGVRSEPELGDVRLIPIHFQNFNKRQFVENFATRIQNKRVRLLSTNTPAGAEQANEMSTFQLKYTANGINITYSAARGHHDDIVIANILANKGILSRFKQWASFQSVENPFYGEF